MVPFLKEIRQIVSDKIVPGVQHGRGDEVQMLKPGLRTGKNT